MPMSYQPELRHYRYFLAVAEELHFRKAAERLYISQPGLSRQIRQMEEGLGVELFERNNRTVSLTPAGSYLKQEIQLLTKRLDTIIAHTQSVHEGVDGSIKMGYVGSAMQQVIPELLIRFNRDYPHIRFNLQELDNDKQIEALVRQQIDVGFVRLNQVPRELEIRPVKKENFCIVLPIDHPLEASNFHNISQLHAESFILFEQAYSPVYYARVMSIFEDSGFVPTVSHSTVHANTIFRLVENGFGVSIVPTSLQLGYNLRVKFIELADIPQQAILYMTWHTQNRNPPLKKLRNLIEKEQIFEE